MARGPGIRFGVMLRKDPVERPPVGKIFVGQIRVLVVVDWLVFIVGGIDLWVSNSVGSLSPRQSGIADA